MGGILYDNILRNATILSDGGSTNFKTDKALDGRTATQAEYATGATREVVFDCGGTATGDTFCIARHNLSTVGAIVTLQRSSDNVTYTTAFSITPTDNKVIYSKQTSITYRYYKLQISGHSNNAYIADVAFGVRADLERSQKHGFIKPEFADSDRVKPNITRGKNLVGLTVEPGLKMARFNLFYYTASFFNTHWSSLITAMKQYPVYVSWDDADTEEPLYCWFRDRVAQPKYSKSIQGYYDAMLDVEGITE
jgi:hypothetical protein